MSAIIVEEDNSMEVGQLTLVGGMGLLPKPQEKQVVRVKYSGAGKNKRTIVWSRQYEKVQKK